MKKKQQAREKTPDKVRSTLWMRRDIWKMVRIAALDKGVSFAFVMEHAAADWLAENRPDLLAARTIRRAS